MKIHSPTSAKSPRFSGRVKELGERSEEVEELKRLCSRKGKGGGKADKAGGVVRELKGEEGRSTFRETFRPSFINKRPIEFFSDWGSGQLLVQVWLQP